jgi:hypothetical protein
MKQTRTELARWLSKAGYETIEPMELYRHMFPAGELAEYTTTPRAEEANQEWKYNAIQYENHCQSFRVVGTRTKKNQVVEAFWLSRKRFTIDELFSQV